MAARMSQAVRFHLMRELDNFVKSPRKQQATSTEFLNEVQREIAKEITLRNIESCCEAFNLRMSDVFKQSGSGRSVYAELYKLEQRVAVLEEKLKFL